MTWKVLGVVMASTLGLAHADGPQMTPSVAAHGNLRVSLACADRSFVRPDDGLQVSVDGVPIAPLRANVHDMLALDSDGNPVLTSVMTDVGYVVTPGRHRIRFEAPDCAPDERELDLSGSQVEHVDGRLATNEPLRGAAVAPDGFAFAVGAIAMPLPTYVSSARITVPGVWLSPSIERRSWLFVADGTSGWSSMTETTAGSVWSTAVTTRVGRRIARGRYALAGGTGIGAGVWIASLQTPPNQPSMTEPSHATFDWSIPVWGTLTAKASCTWGVQALATYNVRPTHASASSLSLAIGLQWQPSHACSSSPGLVTTP